MSRKRTPRSVKNNCDELFSKLIRTRGYCEKCGEKKYELLQPAHIYSRKFGSVRFDPLNVLCLCAHCHRWAHDNPTEFTHWVETIINLDDLKVRKNKISKRKLNDWLELENELKQELNKKSMENS